jgi:hypothetical protein
MAFYWVYKFICNLGLANGLFFFVNLGEYSIGFYSGAYFVKHHTFKSGDSGEFYTVGDTLVIFFSVIIGAMAMGQAVPCLKYFINGK